MELKQMKPFLITAALLATTTGIYWLSTSEPSKKITTPLSNPKAHNEPNGEDQNTQPKEQLSTTTPHNNKVRTAVPSFTQQDYVDITEDRNADFLTHRDTHPYVHYEEETLRALADSGDTVAMKELSVRLTEKTMNLSNQTENLSMTELEKNVRETNKLFNEASEYEKMAVYYGDKEILSNAKTAFLEDMNVDKLSTKEQLLLKLSYDTFIGMRGSKSKMLWEIERTARIHESIHGPISLSPADKEKIHNQASEIYEEIESQRIKLGLGPFDNTPRDYEIKQYSSNLEEHREALGENVFINE